MTSKRRPKPPLPRQDAYTIDDLDQIKVLADPLRIRMLEAFCEERTTKQVAELLGEKPTKLYHHVGALERVGLIALARTRPNRGTVEKYYRAVASAFRADSRVFQPTAKGGNAKSAVLRRMMSAIFDTTSAELAALAEQGEGAAKGIEEEALVSFLDIRAPKAQLEEIRGKLQEIVQSVTGIAEAEEDGEGAPEPARYRLTLAYYPLDSPRTPEPSPRRKR